MEDKIKPHVFQPTAPKTVQRCAICYMSAGHSIHEAQSPSPATSEELAAQGDGQSCVNTKGEEMPHVNKTAECPACKTLLEIRGESLAVSQRNVAKCEECGVEETFAGWPEGWSQTGRSKKYGRAYQSSGIAWHCPTHQGLARTLAAVVHNEDGK